MTIRHTAMGKPTLYIAPSTDGHTAKESGDVEWLHTFPNPDHPDCGYAASYSTVGALVMGRNTYEEIIGFGIEWPYPGAKSYIAARQPGFALQSPDTYLLDSPVEAGILQLQKDTAKNVWLVGGGQLVALLPGTAVARTAHHHQYARCLRRGHPSVPRQKPWGTLGTQFGNHFWQWFFVCEL